MKSAAVASVVITSRNRADDLCGAIQSALNQNVPLEIIIIDDASDDGTPEKIRALFPTVRLIARTQRTGYIVLRNLGARLATTNYIFSIDDDAIFTTPNVVEQTLQNFTHPRIGAVAIPFADIRISPEIYQLAPSSDGYYVIRSFIGTAHALRRDVFAHFGGYREYLIHQGEEGDLCARMLNAGFITRLGTADPVHHFVSPKRDFRRLHYYGTRNNILTAWYITPALALPIQLPAVTVKSLIHGVRIKAFGIKLKAAVCGYGAIFHEWNRRTPVTWTTHKLLRRLRHGPLRLDEIEPLLPPLPKSLKPSAKFSESSL